MATNGLNLQTSGLTFATGTVDRMIIDASGQFGFGTIAPSTDFHVDAAGVRFEGIPSSSSNTNFMVVDGNGVVGTRSDIAVGTVVTDVTEASNVVTVAYNDIADTTFTIDSLTSVAYDTSWGIAQSGTGTVSGNFELPFITAGTYNAGTITLAINGGLESDITITGVDTDDTFVTSGAINSPASGTLRLTRNDGVNVDVTGFSWGTTGDQGTSTMYNGDRLNILGGTGISTVDDGSLSITVTLDDTAVTPGTYGSASETVTFTVDQQGRLTAASEQAIAITASQVTDFDSEVLSSVFEVANFVDSTGAAGIDFTVSAGASVTASLVNSSIGVNGTAGTNSDINLGSDLTFTSSDGSIVATGNGSGGLDLTVDASSVSDSFVTGATLGSGTLTLSLSNGKPDVTASGFQFNLSSDSGVGQVVQLGDTLNLLGGTGITGVGSATDTVTFNLDNTAVTAASYGDASTVATFTVDSQGRLTAAADVTIDITASQVSDFDGKVLASVFEVANFVDSSEIDFSVTAGASVTAELIDGSIGNARLVNDSLTFAGTAGTDSDVDLGGTLTFISSDSSAIITAGGAADTIDITVDGSVTSQNIYNIDGQLTDASRAVDLANGVINFIKGSINLNDTLYVDESSASVHIGGGANAPEATAVLEVNSTTKGFLFPRMTSAQRLAIGTPATGLMVYQTDSREGVYIYKSFGWVQVI
jgi:hypothetical protein